MRQERTHIPETPFKRALEVALNAPTRRTRVQVTNAGIPPITKDGRTYRIRGAKKGTADMVGIVGPYGLYLEIETKATGGRLTKEQCARREMVERFGGVYIAVWPKGKTLGESVEIALIEIDHVIEVHLQATAYQRRAAGIP